MEEDEDKELEDEDKELEEEDEEMEDEDEELEEEDEEEDEELDRKKKMNLIINGKKLKEVNKINKTIFISYCLITCTFR